MAKLRVLSAKCPTCGADLPVPAGATQVTCRYCQNPIHVEHRKPPPSVQPFGAQGAAPSTTLYVDPATAARASRSVGCGIAVFVAAMVGLPVLIGLGPPACRALKSAVRPFPATCGTNERLVISGKSWEGAGPIVESVGHNCKLTIKDAKLKGATLFKTDSFNIELTLENVTVETSDVLVQGSSNMKVRVVGGSLTSQEDVFSATSGLKLTLENTSLESKGGSAVKAQSGFTLEGSNAKIHAKKPAIDVTSGAAITLKKACDVASSGAAAVRATSSLKLDAEGGAIEGADAAIHAGSSADVVAQGTKLSGKEKGLELDSSFRVELSDLTVSAATDVALEAAGSGELTLEGTTIQGTEAAAGKNGLKVKASKKSRLVGTTGNGMTAGSNVDLTLVDSTLEGARVGLKATTNVKVKMLQGAKLAGKRGAIDAEVNLDLDGVASTLDGGAGPAIEARSGTKIVFRQGVVKGTPAIVLGYKPQAFEIDGTRVEGEQKVPLR